MPAKELLASVELEVLAIERCRAGAWWKFREVLSPFSRLWLPLDGTATVTHHGRTYRLRPGELHLIPAFTPHSHHCARPFNLFFLHFTSRLKNGLELTALHELDLQLPVGVEGLHQFRRLETLYPDRKLPVYDPFRDEYRRFPAAVSDLKSEGSPVDAFEATGILRQLLAPFLRTMRATATPPGAAAQRHFAVQEFIHEHLGERLTLADLARVAGLNPTYFSDSFARTVGLRPMDYLTRRRLERAQYLLVTTQWAVKDIAQEVGITDAAYFARVFTRHCRMSPQRYRERSGGWQQKGAEDSPPRR